jgi:predicted nucleotidyltransferase
MNENLLDLSGKIDPLTIELLETVSGTADSIKVPFFVIGATARDIILTHGYGINTIRATHDIDLGVQVPGWQAFNALREALFATGLFSDEREPQRIKFREELLLDLLPFGAITMPNGRLSWPPHHDVQMNTLGFEGAYSSSLTARLKSGPVFEVRLASLAGLAVMKIISWGDSEYLIADLQGHNSKGRSARDMIFVSDWLGVPGLGCAFGWDGLSGVSPKHPVKG